MGWFTTFLIVSLLRLRTFIQRWRLVFRGRSSPGIPYRDDLETRYHSERAEREYLEALCGIQGKALKARSLLRCTDCLFCVFIGSSLALIILVLCASATPERSEFSCPAIPDRDPPAVLHAGIAEPQITEDNRWEPSTEPAHVRMPDPICAVVVIEQAVGPDLLLSVTCYGLSP